MTTPQGPLVPHTRTSNRVRMRLLLAAAVLAIAGSVWSVSQTQRSTADHNFAENRAVQEMLTAMLDQETGVRGFALSRDEEFLRPFVNGGRAFDVAAANARELVAGEDRDALEKQVSAARRWQTLAEEEILRLRVDPGRALNLVYVRARKRAFDRFRLLSAQFQAEVAENRRRDLDRTGLISVAVILAVSLLFGGIGYLVIERQAGRERRRRARIDHYRQSQAEFNQTMQIMRDEGEAHSLVKQHLERTIPDVSVAVLSRNNSANRLVAATELPDGSPLAQALVDAGGDSCLSVRLAREYRHGEGADPLLQCEICGETPGNVTCVPSVVSGEVIGSVLVAHHAELGGEEQDRVSDSVAQAAPVLANLRNLAIAERRAATDSLSGLPNQRACQDNLKRMVAHAGRTLSPVSAVLLDLDHFKQINDRFGHGAGDDVLAAVGDVLGATLRASDFAGRYGGEEFLILLPDTDSDGAVETAEKVRTAIANIHVALVDQSITASLGTATYPVDAVDAETLLRMADRALYAAKRAGRNRVESAAPSSSPAAPAATGAEGPLLG